MTEPLDRPETDERLAVAVGLYTLGDLSLGRAADRAGLSRFEMERALRDSSVDLRLGSRSTEEAATDLAVARRVR